MKISIIVPIYNVEEYLEECLQSIADQTLIEGLECILVDDCGRDNSVAIAHRFIAAYAGPVCFTLIHHEKNGGLSAARNTGIKAARGEYLYFLDSDDTIVPECMELMYGLVEKYGKVDMVQGSFYENEEEKMGRSPYRIPEYNEDVKVIKRFLLQFEGDIVGAQSRLVRRNFLKEHDLYFKTGIIHEDNHWTFFLAKHVRTMAFCPVPTYYHRYNPNSITGNINVEKEALAYRVIIEDFSANIDPVLVGQQKQLILSTLLSCINAKYLNPSEAGHLIDLFSKYNTPVEKILLRLFFLLGCNFFGVKVLHLLFRLYKVND